MYGLRELVRRYIKHAPAEIWRHHQVGMLQAYILPIPDSRIHIWHPDLIDSKIGFSGAVHNHKYEFISTVLAGQIRNIVYALEPNDDGQWEKFRIVQTNNKSKDCILAGDRKRYWATKTSRSIPAGSWYRFPKGAFHENLVDGLTITLVHKRDQEQNAAVELLVPHGSIPVHAFGDPPEIDRSEYLEMAIEALG